MIKLKNIINELGINNPKKYRLTQKGIDLINDINILQKLMSKYEFIDENSIIESNEWAYCFNLEVFLGFDPSKNKLKFSKDELINNIKNADNDDPDLIENIFENIKDYIKEGYVEFK